MLLILQHQFWQDSSYSPHSQAGMILQHMVQTENMNTGRPVDGLISTCHFLAFFPFLLFVKTNLHFFFFLNILLKCAENSHHALLLLLLIVPLVNV